MNPPIKPAPLQFPHRMSLLPLHGNIHLERKMANIQGNKFVLIAPQKEKHKLRFDSAQHQRRTRNKGINSVF